MANCMPKWTGDDRCGQEVTRVLQVLHDLQRRGMDEMLVAWGLTGAAKANRCGAIISEGRLGFLLAIYHQFAV
jgi:hypothetical protein